MFLVYNDWAVKSIPLYVLGESIPLISLFIAPQTLSCVPCRKDLYNPAHRATIQQMQVQEYGKAECTENLFYVFVDTGNPRRLQTIVSEHNKNKNEGIKCPELIIIDANIRKSASKS